MFKRLTLENFAGVKELDVELDPQFVIVEGDNAQGKSTVLDSFRCIADGGGGLELIRNGESKAKLDLVVKDGVVLRKTITQKRANLDVDTTAGTATSMTPKEYVNSLMEGVGYDPLRFVACDKKERLAYLLQVAPITFTQEELAAIGVQSTGAADLYMLAAIEEQIRAIRKRANADVKSAEGTIARLEKDLPPDDGTDWTAQWKALEEDAADCEIRIKAAEKEATEEYANSLQALTEARDNTIADFQRQIAELQAKIASTKDRHEKHAFELRNARDARMKQIAERSNPVRQEIATARAQAWERSQSQGRIAGQRETVAAMKADVGVKFVESERLTATLEKLTALRNKKLSSLPVEGVRITPEGDIFVDDVEFDRLNTATQYMVSFQFAMLKGGRFMLADHGEALGDEAWSDFCRAIRSQDKVQVVVAVRTNGPLTVHRGPTLEELAKGILGKRERTATPRGS